MGTKACIKHELSTSLPLAAFFSLWRMCFEYIAMSFEFVKKMGEKSNSISKRHQGLVEPRHNRMELLTGEGFACWHLPPHTITGAIIRLTAKGAMLRTAATTARRTIFSNASSQLLAAGEQARPFSCLIHTVAASVSKPKDSTSQVMRVESRTLVHGPCLGVIDAARMRQLHVGSSARLSQSDDDTTPAASASCHAIRG